MKKVLLTGSMLAMFAASLNAQQRLVLYEEFSGENCGPCAATNPGLWSLLTSGENEKNILLIKYQAPIPGGYDSYPIYEQNEVDVDARSTYYSVPFAPYARMDGVASPIPSDADPGSLGHPGYLTQAYIDDAVAVDAPFDIEITSYSISGTTLSATIEVTANTDISAAELKFHAALTETLIFSTPPGANGETEFHHVVRKMYPSASGQDMEDVWTSGESHTMTVTGTVPSYVDLSNENFLVVWVQDNEDKTIKQAARTYPSLDVASKSVALPGTEALNCGLPLSVTPKVTIKNGGNSTLTSATIYYKEATASTWSTQPWTGSLATNESEEVTLPAISVTTAGMAGVVDSVGNPNSGTDAFASNNKSAAVVTILKEADGAFPITNNFEASSTEWVPYAESGGYPLYMYTGAGIGYDESTGFLYYPCYQLPEDVAGYMILPFANLSGTGLKALDFYVAYAQYKNEAGAISGDDKLEVVYSTNCGDTWTSVWSQDGADLATAAATGSTYIPAGNSDWVLKSVNVSSVPDGAQLAFRATSDYGNNIFIDNVNLRSGATGIEELVLNGGFSVYPNPVNNELTIDIDMVKAAKATISVVNVVGQQVALPIEESLTSGKNLVKISTSSLVPGIYFLNIATEAGSIQQKFVKK